MNRRQMFLIAVSVLALCGQAWAHAPNGRGVNSPSSDLPPIVPDGVYLSPQDVHAMYSGPALEIVLSMIEHQPFAGQSSAGPDGERHHFESELRGQGSCTGDACTSMGIPPMFPVQMTGPVDTVAYGRPPGGLGTFDTEMLSMSLTGTGGIMVRESPSRPSLGRTSITELGPGGPYHIDSFFDVFTELSLDGGQTWMPSDGGVRVFLGGVPEPASFVLLALGLLGSAGMVRRRR